MKPRRRLYEIGDDLIRIEQLITMLGGELPEGEAGATLERYFDELGEERDEKIRAYCGLITLMEEQVEFCKQEMAEIAELKRINENGAARLKARLKQFFEDHKIEKLNLGSFRPHLHVNSSAPVVLHPFVEEHPEYLPAEFRESKIEIRKQPIKEALAAGVELTIAVPQALLDPASESMEETEIVIARYGEKGNHLRLR